MAILVIAEIPGGTAEQDEAMVKRLGIGSNPPKGSLLRVAGPTPAGWRVVSLWESQEAFDGFRRDRLEPALKEAGRPVPEFQISKAQSVIANADLRTVAV